MRAVWLALLCLIGLATAAAVKIGMAPYASADLSQGVTSAKAEVSPEPNLTDSPALFVRKRGGGDKRPERHLDESR
jgi:hypothetical protein